MQSVVRSGKKTLLIFVGLLLMVMTMFSGTSFAASEGAVKVITNNKSYSGITADIKLPSNADVKTGYVNWYLGIGAAKVEAGISKTPSGYKVFCNTGYKESGSNDKYWISSYDSSIEDGDTVNLKLVNNGDNTLTMYVNGKVYENEAGVKYENRPIYDGLAQYEQVKMVMGVEDDGSNSFSEASFSNVQLRANASGSIYKKWDSSISSEFSRYSSYGDDFDVSSQVPLSASLR
ncbi:hypothetical protein V1503_24610 [Bacillus sp. SCS-151]|uniref:hypothetical protein n=1 Tax=Nanhaiella sioensis TaxID=3115293 RepID=UPI00397E003F